MSDKLPKPAEPSEAWRKAQESKKPEERTAPVWPRDYDTSEQPNLPDSTAPQVAKEKADAKEKDKK